MNTESAAIERPEQERPSLVILAHGRSGSTALRDAVNMHPDVSIDPEPFNPVRGKEGWGHDYPGDLRNGFTLQECLRAIGSKHNGVKHLIGQLNPGDDLFILKSFSERFFLIRRNQLKSVVSAMIATQTSQWHRGGAAQTQQCLNRFSPREVAERLQRQRATIDLIIAVIENKKIDCGILYYEDIFGETIALETRLSLVESIFNRLQVSMDVAGLRSKLERRLAHDANKVNTQSTYRLVPNIAEIEQEFASEENGSLEL